MLEELYEQAKLECVNPQAYCNALQRRYPAKELEKLLYDPDGRHKEKFKRIMAGNTTDTNEIRKLDKDYTGFITHALMFVPALNDLGHETKQHIVCTPLSFASLSEVTFRIIYSFHELQHVRDNFHGLCLPNGRIIAQEEIDTTPFLEIVVYHIMEIRALNNELNAYKKHGYKDDIDTTKTFIKKEIRKLRMLFKQRLADLPRDDLRVLAATKYLEYK
ncbi:MAG: hypothetical protein AABW49_01320 [Nanoarchaeota archaeon]